MAARARSAAVVDGDPPELEVDPWRPNKPRQVATFVFERSPTRQFVSVSPDDGNALADELGRSNDDAAHSGAQKILAAMNLSTRSTRVRLSVAEAAAALAALVTLRAKCALHDPAALERELRARLGRS